MYSLRLCYSAIQLCRRKCCRPPCFRRQNFASIGISKADRKLYQISIFMIGEMVVYVFIDVDRQSRGNKNILFNQTRDLIEKLSSHHNDVN